MTDPGGTKPAAGSTGAPTLDDLAAVNVEMAALVRAGVPLESGLAHVAAEYGGGAAALAARLRDRTAAGATLAEAVDAEGDALPLAYRAAVAAGARSGRLAAALEQYAESAARLADLRRIAAQAGAYPLLTAVTAWILLTAMIVLLLPRFDWLGIGDRIWATPLRRLQPLAAPLALAAPVGALFAAVAWWRRSALTRDRGVERWFGWIPGAARMRRMNDQAIFAELLRLLTACRVPLEESLPLAGAATNRALEQAAFDAADRLAAGRSLVESPEAFRALPPMVRAALVGARSPEKLSASLAAAAETYRRRAADWVTLYAALAPVAAMLAVAGTIAGGYALLVIQPYVVMLKEIASWR